MRQVIFIFIVTFFNITLTSAQNECYIEIANEKLSKNHTDEGFSIKVEKNNKELTFLFRNETTDTLYVFKPYFKEEFINSKYLNRINKKKKIKKLSFLPLTPYLSTTKSDRIIVGERALVTNGSLLYSFIAIPPQTELEKVIIIKNDIEEYSKDFDIKNYNVFNKIKWKKRKDCNKGYNYMLEFAVYKDVKNLCSSDYYFNMPNEFNNKALNYEVFSLIIDK
ncbi:hypothetical protein [Dokdonia sp.]|uniref:hypothetical protein n=1 Tax=Dokdonia sp. TaxID=2024995 RepID=UPI0032666AFC